MSLILLQMTLYFEILLKAALSTVTLTLTLDYNYLVYVLFYLSSKIFKYIFVSTRLTLNWRIMGAKKDIYDFILQEGNKNKHWLLGVKKTWINQKGQYRNIDNIGHTRNRSKTNKTEKNNTES